MPRKKRTAEQIITKLREAEVLLSKGQTTGEVCRQLGVSENTYYRWRKEYGGLEVDQARRLKELEQENARLKKLVADLALDIAILKEAARGNSEPGASTPGGRARVREAGGLRAPSVPGAGSAAVDAAVRAAAGRRRAAAREEDRRAGDGVRPVRLSPDDGDAAERRLAGEPQAGGADLAAGRAEGAEAAAETGAAVAERRIVRPAAAGVPGPRVVVRLRARADARRPAAADADDGR